MCGRRIGCCCTEHDKCRVLHLGFNTLPVQYTYNNTTFSDATTVCDLGVDVDSSLKYDGHINCIVAKAYSRIGILFRGFFYIIIIV